VKTYRHPAATAPGARACLRACPTPSLAVLLPLAAALGLAALSASPTTARAQTAPAASTPAAASRAYAIAPGPLNAGGIRPAGRHFAGVLVRAVERRA